MGAIALPGGRRVDSHSKRQAAETAGRLCRRGYAVSTRSRAVGTASSAYGAATRCPVLKCSMGCTRLGHTQGWAAEAGEGRRGGRGQAPNLTKRPPKQAEIA
eukprot:3604410-Rhodomonas_salina.2